MRNLAIAAAAYASIPAQQALACAVCFAGRDETRVAYLLTTLFMTSLPLFALAAGIIWVVRKANGANQSPPR
jgi:F0F1-type ATP synthase membrane subunit c/vacuolar-type H+-ATPase subunit K